MLNRNTTFDRPNPSAANQAPAKVSTRTDSPSKGRLSVTRALKKVFSFHAFLAALLLGGAFIGTFTNIHQTASSPSHPLRWVESDTLWHIAVGNLILKTHTWPTHDIYSFTVHGSPWIAYEWLGEVLMSFAWKAGNLHGLAILMMALVSVIILALFYYAYLGSKNAKSAFAATAVLLPLAAISWTLRPQLLGYVFLIATLIVLRRFRDGFKKSIWVLPLIFLLWTNSHGTFVLGFGVLGVYWLSGLKEIHLGDLHSRQWTLRERQQLELIALLSLIASIITPYGTQLAAYPLVMAGSQPMIIKIVQEWQPLSIASSYGKLYVLLILAFWILIAARRLRIRLEDMVLLLVATVETFLHARFMLLFVPVFAPLLADAIASWFPPYDETKDHPILNFALIGLIIAGMVEFFPSNAKLQRQLASEMPTRAVKFLRAHQNLEPTFNYFFWGGYLILKGGARDKVFIDGRLDIYEYSGVLADYMSIVSLQPNVEMLLRKYHIRSCLIPPESPLAILLNSSPGWHREYRDSISALFVREPMGAHSGKDIAVLSSKSKTTRRKMLNAGT